MAQIVALRSPNNKNKLLNRWEILYRQGYNVKAALMPMMKEKIMTLRKMEKL